jgi:outer membrane protein OmpA-like peptidoglycan-associated protein
MIVLAFALAVPALAQSQGNQRALDALGPSQATHAHGHARRAARRDAHARATHDPAPAAVPPSPTIPAAPPQPPVIKTPVVSVPLHPETTPPPVPVVASAVGVASGIEGGSRITFGDGSADLNPTGMQALQAVAAQLRADPQARAQIDAYASGTADDPSTPRRLSLSRGLAARAVLINGGVASTRIYVRAIGQPSDSGPADRIDVIRIDQTQPKPASGPNPGPVRADAAPGKAATTP